MKIRFIKHFEIPICICRYLNTFKKYQFTLLYITISYIVFQVHEYLFFSGLMLAETLLLAYLSNNYKYKTFRQRLNDNNDDDNVVSNESEIQLDGKYS